MLPLLRVDFPQETFTFDYLLSLLYTSLFIWAKCFSLVYIQISWPLPNSHVATMLFFFSIRLYIMSPFPHLMFKQLSNLMWLWSHPFSEIALSKVTESIFIAKDIFWFLSYITFELYLTLLVLAFLKQSLSLLSVVLFASALVFEFSSNAFSTMFLYGCRASLSLVLHLLTILLAGLSLSNSIYTYSFNLFL